MTSPAASGLERVDRTGPLPLSFAQQRLWFLDRWDPDGVAYNVPWAVRLRGDLDAAALASAIAGLVERHEILRTVYVCPDGVPHQVVRDPRPVDLPCLDLSATPEEAREAALGEALEEEARRRFDLASDQPIRTALFRLSPREHVLLLTIHHIACDGWSLGVLARELGLLYEAALQARDAALPPLPAQYADYAAWQRAAPADERAAAHLDYWRARLKEESAPLELPIAGPRPPVQTFNGSRYRFALGRPLVERVKALARSERATLYMALASGFAALLHRYSGQRELAIGSPIAGRTRPETEGLIGCFVNTLVLKSSVGPESSFRDLLRHIRDEAFGAYQHQDIPFEQLVETFRPARDASRTPFFQALLALQNVPAHALAMPGLTVEPVDVDTRTSKFDLSLYFTEREGALEGYVEANADLFEREAIARLVAHFETLVDAAVGRADEPLTALPLMDDAERRRTLVDWNATSAPYPDRATLHGLFQEQAARTPEAVAFEAGADRLTFAQLDRQSSALAAHLRAAGLGPGGLAGIAIERSFGQVVAVMAVLKSGAAYVPLDPSYPRERLAFMVQDSGVAVLVSEDRHRGRFPEFRGRFVALDLDGPAMAAADVPQAPLHVAADDPAYVIYTSGSTGTPKGVVAPHRGAVNRLHWMWQAYPFEPGEVCCLKTSLNFVDAVWEVFGPMLRGVPTVMIPDDALKDPGQLIALLAARRVTRIGLVPSLLEAMLSAADGSGTILPDLRYCVTSGEALSVALAKRFTERIPHATLLNLYGSSEVAADVTCHAVRDAASRTSVPIGRPIANTAVYLLDGARQPVPVGLPGEVYAGGDGLALGYLHRPDLTAERFVENPFDGRPGARLYRTGDIGRFRADGEIEYLGRTDHQVKIRGHRIELGEVEAALARHPGVRAAVAVVRDSEEQGRRLIAYFEPHPGEDPPVSDLRRFLRDRLPPYMVPAAFVQLETIPLTPNGKIDRRALSDPARQAEKAAAVSTEPRTETEHFVAGVWRQVLGITRVGVEDNFLDLGGHSLLVMKVLAAVEGRIGRRLHPRDVIFQTLEQLAAMCDRQPAAPEPVGLAGFTGRLQEAGR